MRSSIHTLFACALALSGVLAAGCDEPMNGGDGGTQTGTDGSTSTQDGGTTTDTDGGGDDTDGGTTPTGDCASQATAFCTRYEECDPAAFVLAYENQAICQRVVAANCAEAAGGIPLSNGLTDEDACRDGQVASCEGFLGASSNPIPAACVPLPGQVTEIEGKCFTDAQCGVGTVPSGDMRQMYCRPLMSGDTWSHGTAECPRGSCIPAKPLGSTCNPLNQNVREFCDRFAGQACAKEFDMNDGAVGDDQCRQIAYGTTGDACFPGTEKQCASGFRCDVVNRTCMAVLSEGQACSTDRDLCDLRLGLTCQDLGHGDVCAGPEVAEIGEQCGEVTIGDRIVTRLCSAYADCNESVSPNVCVAKAALGETCTQDPDNCEPGLECDDATDVCVVIEAETPICP